MASIRRGLVCAFALFVCLPLFSQTPPVPTIVIHDVAVIPMDTERMLEHSTVVVREGKIAAMGPARTVEIPAGARVIDGRGKFLMPGLADMHTHVDRAEMLPLFLSAGVTTVLNMGLASPEFVTDTRMRVRRGEIAGPRIYAAFMIDGPGDPGPEYVALCERDARDAVDRAKLVGYEFIKVYDRLEPDVYAAVLDEAKKQKIAVVGHIPKSVGLEKSLAQGQVMIAHSEEYYKTYFEDRPDETKIAPAVALTKAAGAYVTPNLSFFATLTRITADPAALDRRLAEPDTQYLPPDLRGRWLSGRSSKLSDVFVPELSTLRKLTLAMSKAGIPLLAGTDSPLLEMPGSSVDDDLDELVASGLTRFEALAAATRTPGEFIHKFVPAAKRFGTIAEGEEADLLLLRANPLLDLRNVREPEMVIAEGRVYERRDLLAMVSKPADRYKRIAALENEFRANVSSLGVVEAIRSLKAQRDKDVQPTETFINAMGYRLVAEKKLDDAIAVFELNTELYPDSWNAYDSLGEAYADSQRYGKAVTIYRRSLSLNPKNHGAVEALKKAAEMKIEPE